MAEGLNIRPGKLAGHPRTPPLNGHYDPLGNAFALCLGFPAGIFAAGGKTVLILNSFHAELGWTSGIMAATQKRFASAGSEPSLHVEDLDTKGNNSPDYFSSIYGFWDFFLGNGIAGGKLTIAKSNRYMFNFAEFERFGIDLTRLPPGRGVSNRPPSFIRLGKRQLWAGLTVIPLPTLMVVLLLRTMRFRRSAETTLAEQARFATMSADVGGMFARGGSLRENLQFCAEALVRQTDTSFGWIWTVAENDPETLELQTSAGLYLILPVLFEDR